MSSPFPPRYRTFCPHPHPITAVVQPGTPIPRRGEDDGYILTLVRMFCDFILIYVNSFYFLHFVRNVIVLLIFNIAAFT